MELIQDCTLSAKRSKVNLFPMWKKPPLLRAENAPITPENYKQFLAHKQDWHSPVYSGRLEYIAMHFCTSVDGLMQFIS